MILVVLSSRLEVTVMHTSGAWLVARLMRPNLSGARQIRRSAYSAARRSVTAWSRARVEAISTLSLIHISEPTRPY